jgi:hypothetical protein
LNVATRMSVVKEDGRSSLRLTGGIGTGMIRETQVV